MVVLEPGVGGALLEPVTGMALESHTCPLSLLGSQEPSRGGIVRQSKKGDDSADDGLYSLSAQNATVAYIQPYHQAFDDEDPPPSFKAAPRANRREAAGQETAEGAGEGGGRVEDADAQRELAARVDAGEVEHHAGQQAALAHAQDGAHGDEAGVAADEAQAHGDDAP